MDTLFGFKVIGRLKMEHPTMTLRDYFAAKAMNTLVLVPVEQWKDLPWTKGLTFGECLAVQAYKIADAMLVARKGKWC